MSEDGNTLTSLRDGSACNEFVGIHLRSVADGLYVCLGERVSPRHMVRMHRGNLSCEGHAAEYDTRSLHLFRELSAGEAARRGRGDDGISLVSTRSSGWACQ